MWTWASAYISKGHSPSCCSVVAFTCAGRFSVCNRLSYASFAALYFFCGENRKRRTSKRSRHGGCLGQTGKPVFYGFIQTDKDFKDLLTLIVSFHTQTNTRGEGDSTSLAGVCVCTKMFVCFNKNLGKSELPAGEPRVCFNLVGLLTFCLDHQVE